VDSRRIFDAPVGAPRPLRPRQVVAHTDRWASSNAPCRTRTNRPSGPANLGIAGAAATAASVISPAVPTAAAWAGCLSFGAGYSTYDIVHHRLHHRPPTTARGLRMRQRHFRHHFGAPKRNLGVTHGFWDRLAGTEASQGPVRVPSKLAPSWLEELGPDFVAA